MFFPPIDKAKEIIDNGDYKVLPISCEILSDIKTPIEVLKILKNNSKHCFILESMEDLENWGRYTILGFDPTLEITCENNVLNIKGYKNINKKTKNPKKYINQIINENKSPKISELPPFTGGLVGYFAYDYIKYVEPSLELIEDSSNDSENGESFKDVDLMLFDKVIVFDNLKQKIFLIVNIKVNNFEKEYEIAKSKLMKLKDIITNGVPISGKDNRLKLLGDFKPLFSKEEFSKIVKKAKFHIKEGDIFQVVLSNPLSCKIEGSLLDTYRILRTSNPSPYMFYFSSDDIEIAGASPETLVKLQDDKLYTFPLAGTRPRGKTKKEDDKLEKDLLSDEKELAEHNMLVDLGRNDLGKVSEFGSINVEKYLTIERFSHVMHIGSTISGKLKKDNNALDVIDAILPAGTLSGAPKIRACEIINELENNKRGIYGGAIGYISLSGNMDTCIAIRIAFTKGNKVFIRSGAGIVADSIPELEFEESINKAKAVLNALKSAENINL
ncbi:anthranilate synthase component I family protein [Methanobrevibacter sp.]|uniref:anthranilate synthase component I family protein n=1 Tax=Methanobrevibacter sp. TaxID=66852 RepID=UPI00260C867A|nr:chorismate-binding protein [uncultured Methanobrevibacter sp.]